MMATGNHCPIAETAPSVEVNHIISGYLEYKRLNNYKAPESLQINALSESTILDYGSDMLLALDAVHLDYENFLNESSDSETNQNREVGKRKFKG